MGNATMESAPRFQQNHGKPGVVYGLKNCALQPGLLKLGSCTRGSGRIRADELNRAAKTGMPAEYVCVIDIPTMDCGLTEERVGLQLAQFRRGKKGQEFFEIDEESARKLITELARAVDEETIARRTREKFHSSATTFMFLSQPWLTDADGIVMHAFEGFTTVGDPQRDEGTGLYVLPYRTDDFYSFSPKIFVSDLLQAFKATRLLELVAGHSWRGKEGQIHLLISDHWAEFSKALTDPVANAALEIIQHPSEASDALEFLHSSGLASNIVGIHVAWADEVLMEAEATMIPKKWTGGQEIWSPPRRNPLRTGSYLATPHGALPLRIDMLDWNEELAQIAQLAFATLDASGEAIGEWYAQRFFRGFSGSKQWRDNIRAAIGSRLAKMPINP
jgi:hypothetical protein